MAVLRALSGPKAGTIFPLAGDSVILGRHPDCDIVLEAGAVSRQHARILRIQDDYFLEDLRSRNGTFLNDQRIEGQRKLAENDAVKICDLVFAFHQGSPASVARALAEQEGGGAVEMVDDGGNTVSSTIRSRLDVTSGASALRLSANPEVKLKALLEIGKNLGGTVGLGDLLPKLLDNLFTIFPQADRGFIVIKDTATGRLVPKAVKHRREGSDEGIRISRTVVNGVIATREAVLSADAATDQRFDMSESVVDFQIHSMMCAPLIASGGDVLGVIQIDALDQRRRFTPEDLEVLASVACQATVVVENAQLHEIALEEQLLLRELAVAHKVQQGLLPAAPPQLEGYEFFDYYEPASHLGGDYFDYIALQGDRLAVALADVSGKGISAALLMARLSADVGYCLASYRTPAEAVGRLNALFCESRWEDRFVTLALAVLDPRRHELCLVNAGHWAPLLRRASGAVETVGESTGGLPLGVDDRTIYDQCTIGLGPGDTLVLYTDGITDAMNADGGLYGNKRLLGQLVPGFEDAAELGDRIIRDVRQFVGHRPQSDDMCLTILRRLM